MATIGWDPPGEAHNRPLLGQWMMERFAELPRNGGSLTEGQASIRLKEWLIEHGTRVYDDDDNAYDGSRDNHAESDTN